MHVIRTARNIHLGIKTLLLHKLRSFLTMLGVVFGVGSVIAMLAVGEGASKEALDQIRKLGSNNIILRSVKPAEEQQSGETRTRVSMYGVLYEDEERIRETLPHVVRTVPARILSKEASLGARKLELRVVGTVPQWFALVRREVVAGRVLEETDRQARKNVCILTEHGARRLLAGKRHIGQTVRIGGDPFEVVGIVRSESGGGGGIQTPDQEADVYIPFEVSRDYFGEMVTQIKSGSFNRELVELHLLIVQVDRIENVESVATALTAMMNRFHDRQDYRISVPLALLRQAEATQRTFNIVLGAIAAISLLVGGIGIMNIMLASVTERTREIGIRRAIGAKRRQIVGQFLVETVVLATAGGLLGIGMGLLIPWVITWAAGMPTVVTPSSLMLSLGISMGIGILFGIYPAYRAANLDPIVALRHE